MNTTKNRLAPAMLCGVLGCLCYLYEWIDEREHGLVLRRHLCEGRIPCAVAVLRKKK